MLTVTALLMSQWIKSEASWTYYNIQSLFYLYGHRQFETKPPPQHRPQAVVLPC